MYLICPPCVLGKLVHHLLFDVSLSSLLGLATENINLSFLTLLKDTALTCHHQSFQHLFNIPGCGHECPDVFCLILFFDVFAFWTHNPPPCRIFVSRPLSFDGASRSLRSLFGDRSTPGMSPNWPSSQNPARSSSCTISSRKTTGSTSWSVSRRYVVLS